jgi:hypothetical protein
MERQLALFQGELWARCSRYGKRCIDEKGYYECACSLVVIENADLLDKYSLANINRNYLPTVLLVGGERLGQQIAEKRSMRVSYWNGVWLEIFAWSERI